MSPMPGAIAVLTSVTVATGAFAGVKDVIKTVKDGYEYFTRTKCETCQAMVKKQDMDSHRAKHREDEELKQQEEEKKVAMERTIKELDVKMQLLQLEMEANRATLKKKERRQEEVDRLKSAIRVTCELCNTSVPANEYDGHKKIHGKEREGLRQTEDNKVNMRQDKSRRANHGNRK